MGVEGILVVRVFQYDLISSGEMNVSICLRELDYLLFTYVGTGGGVLWQLVEGVYNFAVSNSDDVLAIAGVFRIRFLSVQDDLHVLVDLVEIKGEFLGVGAAVTVGTVPIAGDAPSAFDRKDVFVFGFVLNYGNSDLVRLFLSSFNIEDGED